MDKVELLTVYGIDCGADKTRKCGEAEDGECESASSSPLDEPLLCDSSHSHLLGQSDPGCYPNT